MNPIKNEDELRALVLSFDWFTAVRCNPELLTDNYIVESRVRIKDDAVEKAMELIAQYIENNQEGEK